MRVRPTYLPYRRARVESFLGARQRPYKLVQRGAMLDSLLDESKPVHADTAAMQWLRDA